MADALIASTIELALKKTLSIANERIGKLFQFKEDLENLSGSVAMIQAVLADAEEKQTDDQAVQLWLQRLEVVAFDAENLLDELNYEVLRRQLVGKVRSFILSPNINIVFRRRMASKIWDINKKLNKINKDANDFGLIRRANFPASTTAKVTLNRETDSIAGHYVVGRAKDETRLVETLLSLSEQPVSVIPIRGMGGLGKTTLAQSVYNNRQVDSHFEKKIWVCVSDNFEVTRLLKMILESLTERNDGMTSRDVIVRKIREQLVGKRYLLVLDDVWTESLTLWEDFLHSLRGLNATNGNWCVVTTRQQQTASILATHDPYVLEKLSDDDCWSILTKKAIEGGEIPEQLQVMKKEIIKKCGGLPLAASVMGGVLRMKRKEEWQLILKNKLSNFSGDEDGVMEILKLSFDNLPSPAIKKCFAYCSIFPEDTEMKRDMLIELWMAEGFLQVDLKNKTMEEIGEYYLEILLQSSLLEEIRDDVGRYYKMHDMVHDVAKSIMSKSTRFINSGTGSGDYSNQVRCLVIDSFGEGTINLLDSRSNLLHTLFLSQGSLSDDMLMKLKNLHVLNLSGEENQNLPISIGKLRHLRYINFERSRSETLPESVCKLYNLQTLRLNSHFLKVLPKGMCDLISLRHLHFHTFDKKFQMPLEMGRLTCLQTLKLFNVGREKGRRIGELGSLKNLKGSLRIWNLELVKDKEGAEEAKLSEKANLFELVLKWADDREGDDYNDEDVLDGLRPHPNLAELVIKNFMGDQFPRWLMDLPTTTTLPESAITLPELARLRFYSCDRCRELLPLQNFTSLKELVIDECDGLTNLPGDMLHSCTSLQKLQVTDCGNLISFPLDLQRTPSLLELALYRCPKLKTSMTPKGFGFLTSLRELAIGPFSDDGDDHENSSIYNEFDWSGLTSSSSSSSSALRRLFLIGLPHTESLPPHIQYLTTLTSLTLRDFGGIKALPDWFGNFAALEELHLRGFKELGHLPSEDAMRSLTKLSGCLWFSSVKRKMHS
ncbi:putative disease resistance protein RGA3 [Coffea arabica]|uniref:Disease resistance protein RGA3 n=1 Tax=Coffea arabica TaxID=13443 RepID=A0ABM4WVB1_COFAR